jgi:D-alanyl-D-alanine carboxypeptidase
MRLGSRSRAYRLAFVGLLATAFVVSSSWDCAQARAPRHHAKQTDNKKQAKRRPIHGPNYNPPYAAIVVDANSDQVLHEASPDAPRHPASLTKIMTLYMLFEQIEAGKFKLDTLLPISAHAAMQTPTKLGLKANGTISVEDAIKGMCTRSANDAAVVVGEAVGGTEADFANLMTEKARALGMANTTYVNASGLPAEEQITTARDQAILGRAVQDRFPVYYRYFSTLTFRYRGKEIHNHNGLLGQVKGLDGIKTGYTEASGYNLVTSVRRDQRHIVAVVLGGKSGAARNERMRQLIEEHIPHASMRRTAPAVMQATGRDELKIKAPVEKPAPAIALPPARVTPSESAEPTLTNISAPESQPAKPQTEVSPPQTQAKPQTEASPPQDQAKPQTEASPPQDQAKRQTEASPPQGQPAKVQAPAKAAATPKLSPAHPRRSASQPAPAATPSSFSSVARPDPKGAW